MGGFGNGHRCRLRFDANDRCGIWTIVISRTVNPRCIRRSTKILIRAASGSAESRFPELLEPLKAQLPDRFILDGEIVVAKNGGLDSRNCAPEFILSLIKRSIPTRLTPKWRPASP